MRVYAHDRAEAGEYLDPRPLNNELRNVISRANHLDRWAFDADLPASKFTPAAFGEFGRWTLTVDQVVTIAAAQYDGFGEFTPGVQIVPIPNNAGASWVEDYDTGDGLMRLDLMLYVETAGNTNGIYRPGVQVDGALHLGAAVPGAALGDSLLTHLLIPVGAGTRRLAPVLFAYNGTPLVSWSVTFKTRTLSVRTGVR
jgi:hypothetical protein